MKSPVCDRCGKVLEVGMWPWCPHEAVGRFFHEGFDSYVDCQLLPNTDKRCTDTDELGRRGVPISSRSERRQLMKETGVQFGSDHPGGREV